MPGSDYESPGSGGGFTMPGSDSGWSSGSSTSAITQGPVGGTASSGGELSGLGTGGLGSAAATAAPPAPPAPPPNPYDFSSQSFSMEDPQKLRDVNEVY